MPKRRYFRFSKNKRGFYWQEHKKKSKKVVKHQNKMLHRNIPIPYGVNVNEMCKIKKNNLKLSQ